MTNKFEISFDTCLQTNANVNEKDLDKPIFLKKIYADLYCFVRKTSNLKIQDYDQTYMTKKAARDYLMMEGRYCVIHMDDLISAEEYLITKHQQKIKNKTTEKLTQQCVEPTLKKIVEDCGLIYNDEDKTIRCGYHLEKISWIEEALNKAIEEKLGDTFKNLGVTFKSNLKGIHLTRSLGKLKFNKKD